MYKVVVLPLIREGRIVAATKPGAWIDDDEEEEDYQLSEVPLWSLGSLQL